MPRINDLSTTAASNTDRFPENMAPSAVNDGARELEAVIAGWYQDTNTSVIGTLSGSVIQATVATTSITATGTTSNYLDNLIVGITMGANPITGPAQLYLNGIVRRPLVDMKGASLSSSVLLASTKFLAAYNRTAGYFQLLGQPSTDVNNIVGDTTITDGDLTINRTTVANAIINLKSADGTGDIAGELHFGQDALSAEVQIANLVSSMSDNTAGSEDARLEIGTIIAGTLARRFYFGAGFHTSGATGGDQGADTINTSSYLKDGVALAEWPAALEGETVTTSGTTVTIATGISSAAQRITIMFEGVSIDAAAFFEVQLGDSGGFETTGYTGGVSFGGSTSANGSGFEISSNTAAANVFDGHVVLTLKDSANNTWIESGTLANSSAGGVAISGGAKSLSGTLTQIRLSAQTGNFDAGSVNVLIE